MNHGYQAEGLTLQAVKWALLAAACLGSVGIQAQGTFTNLDFEMASLVPVEIEGLYLGYYDFDSALPFWTGYCGTNQQTTVRYNSLSLSAAQVSIIDSNFNQGYFAGTLQHGNYSVLFQAGLLNGPPGPTGSTSLAQVGQVPSFGQSLLFNGYDTWSLQVSFNGSNLPVYILSSRTNYGVYACDVRGFAGQTGELRFTTMGNTIIDNLLFSPYPLFPQLSVNPVGDTLNLSWPFKSYPSLVQQSPDPNLGPWTIITNRPTGDGSRWYLTLPIPPESRYYRLISQ